MFHLFPVIVNAQCLMFNAFGSLLSLVLCAAATGHHLHRKQMFFVPFVSRERQMDGESAQGGAAQQGKHAVGGIAANDLCARVSQVENAECNVDYQRGVELHGVDIVSQLEQRCNPTPGGARPAPGHLEGRRTQRLQPQSAFPSHIHATSQTGHGGKWQTNQAETIVAISRRIRRSFVCQYLGNESLIRNLKKNSRLSARSPQLPLAGTTCACVCVSGFVSVLCDFNYSLI